MRIFRFVFGLVGEVGGDGEGGEVDGEEVGLGGKEEEEEEASRRKAAGASQWLRRNGAR